LEQALEQVDMGPNDIVLADMSILSGQGPTEKLAQLAREHRVVAFAAADADAVLLACIECGIVGFVPRDASGDDLIATIEGALRGEAKLSPQLALSLMQRLAAGSRGSAPPPATHLTRRERQILALIDEGLTNKEIAQRLQIEVATVKNHVHSILEKTRVRRRGEAAALTRRFRR
jgi:DNA-binding NarL/FixJ family response regulator